MTHSCVYGCLHFSPGPLPGDLLLPTEPQLDPSFLWCFKFKAGSLPSLFMSQKSTGRKTGQVAERGRCCGWSPSKGVGGDSSAPSGSCVGWLVLKAALGDKGRHSWRNGQTVVGVEYFPRNTGGCGESFKGIFQENYTLIFVFLKEISAESNVEAGLEGTWKQGGLLSSSLLSLFLLLFLGGY